jgi:hypothetical protein
MSPAEVYIYWRQSVSEMLLYTAYEITVQHIKDSVSVTILKLYVAIQKPNMGIIKDSGLYNFQFQPNANTMLNTYIKMWID